jgi:hypothetical protein
MTHVQHKTIHKWSSQKKEFIVLIFVKFVENQTSNLLKIIFCPNHCVTIIKHTILGVFCILIPQLFKFWKFKIETTKPCFLN